MAKILLSLYVLTTSAALVVLKLGTKSGAPITYAGNKIHFNITLYTTIGIFLYGVSFLVYTYLISKYDLGYIIPLTTAFVYVAIFLASYFIFHEVFTAAKIVGICLIMTGVVFLNSNK